MSLLLALLAGLLPALAPPPFGVTPGLLGFGLLMHLIDRAGGKTPLRAAFFRSWLAGAAYFGLSCWWVVEAFLVDAERYGWMAPFAILFLALGIGLFWGLGGVAYRLLGQGLKLRAQAGPIGRCLIFAGAFTAAEWLRGHVLTGFPWNLPGEAWRAGGAMSQGAAVFGAYGLTFITLLVATLICQLHMGRRGVAASALGASSALGLMIFGLLRLQAAPHEPGPGAPVVRIVQAKVEQRAKTDEAQFRRIFDDYLRLSSQPAARRPEIIIWPEGALPYAFADYLARDAWTSRAIAAALAPGQTLMIGGYRYEGEKLFNSVALVQRRGLGEEIDWTPVYDKHRLVPFGEYLPLKPLFEAIGVRQLVQVGEGFSSGPPPGPVRAAGIPLVQPLICYEDIFPGFTRAGAARSGRRAAWIATLSNDAWFGATSGPIQHFNLAAYRAIEEGLPMARATPTGVSGMIDAYGRSRGRLGVGRQGVIDAALPPPAPLTLYARLGDLPLLVMLLASSLAVALRHRWRR